ncbi:WbqC family protein [Nostoc sp. ChiVER01]|uniref:WbqC family protein n=1 Tax=Nostoc sp. ChiVER01 TaxID=3075382 RepID=UPI002AD56F12|nr:WbqC family protein [Nostoc sp. ChiVER01]MDZ8221583.1 WbqC family protein [Nostoc sp. ChiVER01]
MIVSINQPAYLPWLGYFHRIAISKLHIVLDHVQFEKNSFTNRNKVKTTNDWCWLTVPVRTKNNFGSLPIHKLEIDNNTNWRLKHWQTIYHSYKKTPYFQEHSSFFESVYQHEWQYLSDLCREITNYLLSALKINTSLLFSSQMHPEGVKDELVLNLCQKVGANIYLSGILGQDYIRQELFEIEGIKVIYQNYHHPNYPQYRGKNFEPYMSIIDLLFNCGSQSRDILLNNQDLIQTSALV